MSNAVQPHIPVLLKEVVAAIAPKDGEVYVDGTFGNGGYSRALLQAADCRVIGIDRDPSAVARGREMEAEFGERFQIVEGRFGDMAELIEGPIDGVALDIGVSSMQIDEAERGFSFMRDGPLDMRMEQSGPSAADVVNNMDEADLADIIYRYGEDRLSRRIARAIVAQRKTKAFERTGELADCVRSVVPRSPDGIDPATRTFQGLRIYVNDELGELRRGMIAAEQILRPGGRLAIVTFHSLEDREVKTFLRSRSGGGSQPSRHIPVAASTRLGSFELTTRKAVGPGEEEIRANPRARSAKLRAAIRTEAAAWGGKE